MTYVELHVPEFDSAKQFYGSIGFAVKEETSDYLIMTLGTNSLRFYKGAEDVHDHSYFKKFSKDSPRGYAVEIIVVVADLDAVRARCTNVTTDITQRTWGARDFRVADPYGFYLCVTEPYPGVE